MYCLSLYNFNVDLNLKKKKKKKKIEKIKWTAESWFIFINCKIISHNIIVHDSLNNKKKRINKIDGVMIKEKKTTTST